MIALIQAITKQFNWLVLSSPNYRLDAAALAAQNKPFDDIIKSSKFPAAHAPAPNEIPKIETEYWPGPPSLAAVGMKQVMWVKTHAQLPAIHKYIEAAMNAAKLLMRALNFLH